MAGVDPSGSGGIQATDGAGTATGLVSMADYFLGLDPQRIHEAVQCLMGALALTPPPRIEARARLQLGMVLYRHTCNLIEAREHLDKAMLVSQAVAHGDDVRFEATCVSARILVEQGSNQQAKTILRSVLESSPRFPYWHCRLLFQLIDVMSREKDVTGVCAMLTKCAEYTQQVDAPYTRLLSMLYKGAYLLTHRNYAEAAKELSACRGLLDGYKGRSALELEAFYLIIQVAHLLVAGQVKTSKPHLKKLQQCVKSLSSEPEPLEPTGPLTAESFHWLSRKQIYIIVYLVSMMHWVQAGYTEKALTFADKAMRLIDEHKGGDHIFLMLKAHLLENTILCYLMQGTPTKATDDLQQVIEVCHQHPQLVYSHRAVLHALLGLYALSLDNFEKSVSQFTTALQHTNDPDLRTFIILNLAIAYMKMGPEKDEELSALMQSLQVDSPSTACQSLKAAAFYVRGLYSSCQLKLHDAKRHLRESLVMSNTGDLNKLTTCSLILLGQIFLSLGNTKETMDMVSPAMLLASKIPDRMLQLWASRLLGELHHMTGNQQGEDAEKEQYARILRELQTDQAEAMKSPHSGLVQWTVGDWPVSRVTAKEDEQSCNRMEHSGMSVGSQVTKDIAKSLPSGLAMKATSSSHVPPWSSSEHFQGGKVRNDQTFEQEPMEVTVVMAPGMHRKPLPHQGDALRCNSSLQQKSEVNERPFSGGRLLSSVTNERPPSSLTNERPPSSLTNERPPSSLTNERPPSSLTNERPPSSLTNERPPSSLTNERPPSSLTNERPPSSLTNERPPSSLANERPPPNLTRESNITHHNRESYVATSNHRESTTVKTSEGTGLVSPHNGGRKKGMHPGDQSLKSLPSSPWKQGHDVYPQGAHQQVAHTAQGSAASNPDPPNPLQRPSQHSSQWPAHSTQLSTLQVSSPSPSQVATTSPSQLVHVGGFASHPQPHVSPRSQTQQTFPYPQAQHLAPHPQAHQSSPRPQAHQPVPHPQAQNPSPQLTKQVTPPQTKDSPLTQMLRAQGTLPAAHPPLGAPLVAQSRPPSQQGGGEPAMSQQHTQQQQQQVSAQPKGQELQESPQWQFQQQQLQRFQQQLHQQQLHQQHLHQQQLHQQQFHQQQLHQQQKLLHQQQLQLKMQAAQQLKQPEQPEPLSPPTPPLQLTPSQHHHHHHQTPPTLLNPQRHQSSSPKQHAVQQPVAFQQPHLSSTARLQQCSTPPTPLQHHTTPPTPLQHHSTPPTPLQHHPTPPTPLQKLHTPVAPSQHVTPPSPSPTQQYHVPPTPSHQLTGEQVHQQQVQQKTLQQFQQHQFLLLQQRQQQQLLDQEQGSHGHQSPLPLTVSPQQNALLQYQQQQQQLLQQQLQQQQQQQELLQHFSPHSMGMSSMSLVEKQRRQAILQHQYSLQQQQLQQQQQQQQLSGLYQQQQQQQLLRHMGFQQQQFIQPSAFGSLSSVSGAEDKSLPQQLGHIGGLQRVNQEYPSFQAGHPSGLSYGTAGSGAAYYASNGATMLGQGGGGGSSLFPGQPPQESSPNTMNR